MARAARLRLRAMTEAIPHAGTVPRQTPSRLPMSLHQPAVFNQRVAHRAPALTEIRVRAARLAGPSRKVFGAHRKSTSETVLPFPQGRARVRDCSRRREPTRQVGLERASHKDSDDQLHHVVLGKNDVYEIDYYYSLYTGHHDNCNYNRRENTHVHSSTEMLAQETVTVDRGNLPKSTVATTHGQAKVGTGAVSYYANPNALPDGCLFVGF